MRIALICQPVKPVPAIRGGAISIFIDGIVPYLSKNHEVSVFSISDRELPMLEHKENATYIRFPKNEYDQCLQRELSNRSFDIIHVFNRPKAVARLKKASPNSRFLTSIHGEKFCKKRMTDTQVIRCKKNVDTILTVSNYIENTVLQREPSLKSKIHTLYLGADHNRFIPKWNMDGKKIRNNIRTKLNLQGKKVILFTGQLTSKKGAHILLEAFQYVLKKEPSAHLLIVGSANYGTNQNSPYVQLLKNLSKKMINHVTFTGFIKPHDIPDYFVASDIFVCSSQWQEPVARVHYEAMATGLPIITTNRGGNAEVIQHHKNGLVIHDYQDPKAFSKVISYLLRNKSKAKKLGKQARKDAESFYNWERVSNELLAYYKTANLFTISKGNKR